MPTDVPGGSDSSSAPHGQRTHRYHPILRATSAWTQFVNAERAKAIRTVEDREERDRERKAEAIYHEEQWRKEHGG